MISFFLPFGATAPSGPRLPHSLGFQITHNHAPQSVGLLWTSDRPVAKTSTLRHKTQTSMSPVGFEPTISAGEQPQTYALHRSATGTGQQYDQPQNQVYVPQVVSLILRKWFQPGFSLSLQLLVYQISYSYINLLGKMKHMNVPTFTTCPPVRRNSYSVSPMPFILEKFYCMAIDRNVISARYSFFFHTNTAVI